MFRLWAGLLVALLAGPPVSAGVEVSDAAALKAWIAAHATTPGGAGKVLLRAPVRFQRDDLGQIQGAHIGATPVALDDGALGISLADRAGQHCPAQGECALWLDGTWGPLVPMPGPPAGPTFAVRQVVGPVKAGEPLRMSVAPPLPTDPRHK